MNDVAAGIATSMNFGAADTSAAATADTTTVLTEASTTSAAAAGCVASSYSAGSQEATKTLKFGVFESDNDELLISGISNVINSRKTFSDEDWPKLLEIRFVQESEESSLAL
jgi:hypothetical protein